MFVWGIVAMIHAPHHSGVCLVYWGCERVPQQLSFGVLGLWYNIHINDWCFYAMIRVP